MYYLCPKCELNFVEKENEICSVCQKSMEEIPDEEIFLCEECGAVLRPWEKEYCKFCRSQLKK